MADIDTRKLFFNAHIKLHIDYASVVWDRRSDVLKRRLNSLHRRVVKLIFPDTTPTAVQKFKKTKIMSLHKQLEYKKGLFMYRVDLNSEAPEYISNLYTFLPSRYSNFKNNQLSLPRPRLYIIQNKSSFLWCLTTYL